MTCVVGRIVPRTGEHRAGTTIVVVRGFLSTSNLVIARELVTEAIYIFSNVLLQLDCFATLAMTGIVGIQGRGRA
jgi:hypothetical protein